MAIFPTKDSDGPPFNYTVGFWLREHPEILIMGLTMETMHGLLGVIYEQVRSGTRFNPDTYYQFVIENHRVAFVEITDPMGAFPMTMTERLMGDRSRLCSWSGPMHRIGSPGTRTSTLSTGSTRNFSGLGEAKTPALHHEEAMGHRTGDRGRYCDLRAGGLAGDVVGGTPRPDEYLQLRAPVRGLWRSRR